MLRSSTRHQNRIRISNAYACCTLSCTFACLPAASAGNHTNPSRRYALMSQFSCANHSLKTSRALRRELKRKRFLLNPKKQRFVISENVDDSLLKDSQFLDEFRALKDDGSFYTQEELDQRDQQPEKYISTKERKQREFEKIIQQMTHQDAPAHEEEPPPQRIIDEEYSNEDAKPHYVSVGDQITLQKQGEDAQFEYEEEDDDSEMTPEEALDEMKSKMRKWRNKRMRREFREKNAYIIKNKLASTKELLREHFKEVQMKKRARLRSEEKQQAHRLGLASGSLDAVREYMKEQDESKKKSKRSYTDKDEHGIAPYQYAYATKIQEALQGVLEKENKNRFLEQVLIYHVRVDPSKRFADVLWDFKYEENKHTVDRSHTNDMLQQASGFLASRVGNRLKSKYAPKFTFYYYEDFSRDTRFHSLYDTFDELGFKTTMEERYQEHHDIELFNPHFTSPQIVTKSQHQKWKRKKKKRVEALGKSKWVSAGRF